MSTPNLEDLPPYTYDDYVLREGRWELIYGVAHALSPKYYTPDSASTLQVCWNARWKTAWNVMRCSCWLEN